MEKFCLGGVLGEAAKKNSSLKGRAIKRGLLMARPSREGGGGGPATKEKITFFGSSMAIKPERGGGKALMARPLR